jgi:SP family sugar porter-like MFS transporter
MSNNTLATAEEPMTASSAVSFNLRFIWLICLVAALGGLLFGYDWVVIGGARPFFEPYFRISDNASLQGWAVASALVGCMIGAIASGVLADRFGRKRLLMLAAFLFTASAVGTAFSWSFGWFNIFRLIGGAGIGLASNLSPMYIAEISPAKVRGRFVSINQLTIVVGILAAQITNWIIANQVVGEPISSEASAAAIRDTWHGQSGWRWMFGTETVPAVAFFLLTFMIPESPRWLVKYGRFDQARQVLRKVGGEAYAEQQVKEIRSTLSTEEIAQVRYRDLLQPRLAKILALGSFLAVFQQWCGINVIFNYAPEVFDAAGYDIADIMFQIVITGVVNLIFTVVAMMTVDKFGRRGLMLLGSIGLTLIYAVLGSGYYMNVQGSIMVALVVLAIACYAVSLAPVVWVLISELFPNRIRGAAVSIAVFSLWAGSALLVYTFPILNQALGAHGTFWIYGGICAIGAAVTLAFVPETKGKSLEEIEQELVD